MQEKNHENNDLKTKFEKMKSECTHIEQQLNNLKQKQAKHESNLKRENNVLDAKIKQLQRNSYCETPKKMERSLHRNIESSKMKCNGQSKIKSSTPKTDSNPTFRKKRSLCDETLIDFKRPSPAFQSKSKPKMKIKSKKKEKDKKNEIYEVERLLDHRTYRGKLQFYVRWKNFSKDEDSWVNEKDLNCPLMLKNHLKAHQM